MSDFHMFHLKVALFDLWEKHTLRLDEAYNLIVPAFDRIDIKLYDDVYISWHSIMGTTAVCELYGGSKCIMHWQDTVI